MVIESFINLFLHLDVYLAALTESYGVLVYLILFIIIFAETGLVVAPFLPGDSLLFAAGALAAIGSLNVIFLAVLLMFAAILGDSLNYAIGKYLGPRVFHKERGWFFNKKHLQLTQDYYEKHGSMTIVLARFIPIIRTFAPFVAGIGSMRYSKFLAYNIAGGIAWIALFVFGGYFFGNIPLVKDNFGLVIIAIILISILPIVIRVIINMTRPKISNRGLSLPRNLGHRDV